MSLVSRCAVTITILAAASCSAAPPAARCPDTPAPKESASAASSAAAPKLDDGAIHLGLTISPDPRTGEVAVEVVAEGDPAKLMRWAIREQYVAEEACTK